MGQIEKDAKIARREDFETKAAYAFLKIPRILQIVLLTPILILIVLSGLVQNFYFLLLLYLGLCFFLICQMI